MAPASASSARKTRRASASVSATFTRKHNAALSMSWPSAFAVCV